MPLAPGGAPVAGGAWLRLGLLLGLALLAGACSRDRGSASIEAFLERHWAEPIAAQGEPPRDFGAVEASLGPQACGQCHVPQWQQWQTSLHARAMGPGLRWQLHVMDQAAANRCLRCHAPLAEQKALVAQEMGWPARPSSPPPPHVPQDLAERGLVCAACHVRGHRRYGPEPGADRPLQGAKAHGGFEATAAFSDSRFCAACHQFPADWPRTNGKLHEDTYEQWKASPFAGRQTCQDCHMPGRQHLWRGIHDRETTRRAIEVELAVSAQAGQRAVAVAIVRNVGAGHHFPTYMVPKVELRFELVTAAARIALGRRVIGWTVDTDLTREIEDTRIPAGESRRFEIDFERPPAAAGELELVVVVRPGEHYERTFTQSLERAARWPAAALPPLREALGRVRAAEYELMRVRRPLGIAN